jgi:hypothetical protein
MVSLPITRSTERVLSQQPEEEILEVENDGVAQSVEIARKELNSTVLPDCVVCSLSVVSAFLTIP